MSSLNSNQNYGNGDRDELRDRVNRSLQKASDLRHAVENHLHREQQRRDFSDTAGD